jgi:hypothetical protein
MTAVRTSRIFSLTSLSFSLATQATIKYGCIIPALLSYMDAAHKTAQAASCGGELSASLAFQQMRYTNGT